MKKRRVLLSGVSILLVLCLLIGGTMAWFTDTAVSYTHLDVYKRQTMNSARSGSLKTRMARP